MAVGAVGSSDAVANALIAKGLSSDKVQRVQSELKDSVAASTSADGTVDGKDVRAKLDQKIADDVKSGKLSDADAATITKVLDDADQASGSDSAGASGTKGAGKGGGPRGGGGGGGGSTDKTELSRTVEITGSIKTTTIKYTDGTSETKTSFANGEKSKKADAASSDDGSNARNWMASIEPGSLVDKLA